MTSKLIKSRALKQAAGVGLLLIAAGLTVVLGMAVWKAKDQEKERAGKPRETLDATMKLTNMEYTEMEGGRRVWILRAEEAKYFEDDEKTLLTRVKLILFLKNGEKILLESQKGVLYVKSKDIDLWGTIQARAPYGYEIFTERARYDHKKQMVSSQTPIRVVGPDLELDGKSWRYDIANQRGSINGSVRGILKPSLLGRKAAI